MDLPGKSLRVDSLSDGFLFIETFLTLKRTVCIYMYIHKKKEKGNSLTSQGFLFLILHLSQQVSLC